MDELRFRSWLARQGYNKKVSGDFISRLKRVEREINHCDLDEEYRSDKCQALLSFFDNKGLNEAMARANTTLPVGKYQLSTFRYAVRKYISFLECSTPDRQ